MKTESESIRPRLLLTDATNLKNVLHTCLTIPEIRGYMIGEELSIIAAIEIKLTELLALAETRKVVRNLHGSNT